MSSTVKEIEPSFKGKVTFIYLLLDNREDSAFAGKLNAAKPTTLVLIGKDGKVREVMSGVREKSFLEEKFRALDK